MNYLEATFSHLAIGDVFAFPNGRKKYVYQGYSPFFHSYYYTSLTNYNKGYYSKNGLQIVFKFPDYGTR
ncbi:hypothetical protein D0T49_03065 [Paludibacter sp. 221]|uniref:hypothetical protein n=1 Tax=Paludibacter sp. 221 TaxID=2302939 RepID=UPI0013D88922|nr:hypothetical protein [Paludibacter sp. 221]NDV46020.1 hypothetical protein [Paludibacter sp. 221]